MLHRIAAVLAAAAVVVPSVASAEIFRYTDSRGVSHYVDGLHNVPDAYRGGAAPVGLRNDPTATSPAPEAARGPAVTTIRYVPGQKIIVDARINGGATTRLLLDTGADHTLISPQVLVTAGVSLTWGALPARVQGVGGTAEVLAVPIESIEIGDAKVGRMYVVSHDIGELGVDGLLGRDFLDQFKVTIDAAGGVVTLAPK